MIALTFWGFLAWAGALLLAGVIAWMIFLFVVNDLDPRDL